MRRVVRFDAAALLDTSGPPSNATFTGRVLARLGIPRDVPPTRAWQDLADDATVRLRASADPRAVVQEITGEEFRLVHRGDGRNASPAPLDLIYPRASSLALFVATLGESVSDEIARCFGQHDPALAAFLDAAASEAANTLSVLLAAEFANGSACLPYSPGYCGWDVSGQPALFDVIRPDDIGVTLNDGCLMAPVKSVSGILLAGDATVHRFRPDYPFCDDCSTRECLERMRSLR